MITYTEAPSGGGSVISVNNAGLNALINTNSIVSGQQYLVSPVNYVNGSGVLVTGTGPNSVSSNGTGNFLNADYQLVGNYSGVPGYTATIGIWDSAYAGFTIGDVVIWNNKHYQSITGLTGSAPSTDAVNWLYLPPSITNGYIAESDFVTYDSNPLVNAIVYREDKRENKVMLHTKGLPNTLLDFQWGRDDCRKNVVYGLSIWSMTNCQALILGNFCDSGEYYSYTNHINPGSFASNFVTSNAILRVYQNSGSCIGNILSSAGQIDIFGEIKTSADFTRNNLIGGTITIQGFLDSGCNFDDNHVNQLCNFEFQNIKNSDVRRNKVIQASIWKFTGDVENAIIRNNIVDSSSSININSINSFSPSDVTKILNCRISNNSSLTMPFLGDDILGASEMNNCIIENNSIVSYPSGVAGRVFNDRIIHKGYSNWQENLDFSDPTICDPINLDITIPTYMTSFVGEFTCSNVPLIGASVTNIKNGPTLHPFIFKPSSIDSLPVSPIAIAGAVLGDVIANSGVALVTYVGRANGCDEITFKAFGDFVGIIESSNFA